MKQLPAMLIVLGALLLAGYYSAVVPLGEGPDEPGHAGYVFFLARTGRLPEPGDVPGEGHQPPLAYALAVPATLWLPASERTPELAGNPRFMWAGGDQINALAHGTAERGPWRGVVLAWHLVRLVSALWGGLAVLFTFLAARQVFAGTTVPLLAAALVGLNPQFLFSSALASNDPLLAALGAVVLWLACGGGSRWLERGVWRAVAAGAVLGLGMLTKQSALVFAPVLALALLRWRWGSWRGLAAWLLDGVVLAGVALLICGWWFARNWQLYGDPFGLAAFQAEFTTQPFDPTSAAAWQAALLQLHASFWARFGWMNVFAPVRLLWAYAGLVALGALGMLVAFVRWLARPGERMAAQVWAALAALAFALAALAWLGLFAHTAGLVAWQGRLLFPALPALALLLAWGIGALVPRRAGVLVVPALLLALAGVAAWLPAGVIAPAYPQQALSEQEAVAWPAAPAYGRFGLPGDPGAELRGARFAGPYRGGDTLELALLWQALGRQNRDWTVFVHLVDANETIVAKDNSQPRGGAFPMSQWVRGDWIEDRHTLLLPADLAPGSYTLRVGLFDGAGTQERAGMWDSSGKLAGEFAEFGPIQVVR